ncbi:AVID protein, partial [Furnarius figulus]|nr:AVID protein [Furnarius figulus]NWR95626.1 AVID protein [Furnarius figulus]
QCNLTGDWKNDLGSNMTISAVDQNGSFNGLYNTSVAVMPIKIQPSPLLGFQHLTNPIGQPTFGFTVNWTFSDSVTVFTGQCFVDENGEEVLKTLWLLRAHADKIEDDWKATRVGTNVFHRLEEK